MVDERRLIKDSSDALAYQQALAHADSSSSVLRNVLLWLKQSDGADRAGAVVAAFVPAKQTPRLHIQLSSHDALASALAAYPFLVRCGSASSGSVWEPKPCRDKMQLPELLKLTVQPTRQMPLAQLDADVNTLLTSMQLEHTAVWSKQQLPRGRNGQQPSSHQLPLLVIHVLPRRIALLAADLERVHSGAFELWGGTVRAQAPNTPALRRCGQCQCLGHDAHVCPKYTGLALRLLGKQPLPYALLLELQQSTGAKAGFLGSSMEEMQPSRRLTLLFDIGEEDAQALSALVERMESVLTEPGLVSALQQPPSFVSTRDRTRECKECGSLDKLHDCPFAHPMRQALTSRQRTAWQSFVPASGSAPPAVPQAAPQAARAADKMCHAWRRNGTCPRAQCEFEHPKDHQPQLKECFAFKETGHCDKGTMCRFLHAAVSVPVVVSAQQPSQPQQQPSGPQPMDEEQQAAPAASAAASSRPSSKPAAAASRRRKADSALAPALPSSNPFDALARADDIDGRSWGQQCEDEEERVKTVSSTTPPMSSLSSLSAPTPVLPSSSETASPNKRRRAGTAATTAESAAASPAASAASNAAPTSSPPSRSSSSTRRKL